MMMSSRTTTVALRRLSPIVIRASAAAERDFVGQSRCWLPRQLATMSQATPLSPIHRADTKTTTTTTTTTTQLRFFSDNSSDAKEKQEEVPENEKEAAEDGEAEEGAAELSEEEQAIANLEAEVKNLKDQLLRSLAEQDNIRRIARRDVESARNFAVQSFAKSLLDTSDNLTRAMEAVPEAMRNDKEDHHVLATLFEGIHMTDENLTKAFEKNGLVKFGAEGDKFDPNMHDAMFEYANPSAEAGSVGQVLKVGFMLHGRVIRPAEVGVVKKE